MSIAPPGRIVSSTPPTPFSSVEVSVAFAFPIDATNKTKGVVNNSALPK